MAFCPQSWDDLKFRVQWYYMRSSNVVRDVIFDIDVLFRILTGRLNAEEVPAHGAGEHRYR